MRVLFYGGKLHGSVRDIPELKPVEVFKNYKTNFRAYSDPATFVSFDRDRYEPMLVQNSTWSYHTGRTTEGAVAMVCQGKTYNGRKVWRMMNRYNALPKYSVWVDTNG